MSPKIRIGIVDPHPFFRLGLEQVLLQQSDIEVVGVGANTEDLVVLVENASPDLVVLDTDLKGDAIKVAADLKQKAKKPVQFIFLTASERYEDVTAALRAGASGYILKAVSPSILLHTLRLIVSGETYVTPQLAGRLLKRNPESEPVDPLNFREAQILGELASGQTNKEIARKVGISEKTVKHYVGRILQKLSVRNRTEAVIASQNLAPQERLQPSAQIGSRLAKPPQPSVNGTWRRRDDLETQS